MKNLFKSIMFVAAAAMTFTSCSKDEESVVTPESKNITLSFSSEKPELEGTRTEHNGTTIVWSHGDKIRMAYTLDGTYMGANAGEAAKFYTSNGAVITEVDATHNTATFNVNGSFKDNSEGEYRFFTLYPSDAYDNSNATIADAPSVPVKVADTQSPKAASFDSAADIMIGQSAETYTGIPADRMVSLLWNRLVAHTQIKFDKIAAVDGETVNFVTFTAEEGKELTGTYYLNIETGEFTAKTASNSVKLSAGNGLAMNNGQLTAWFCSLPFTTSQFTVVIDTNKATYTREINAGKVLDFKKNSRNMLSINMTSATRVEKAAEVQLIPDGDYVIATDDQMLNTTVVGNALGNTSLPADAWIGEGADRKLAIDDDTVIWNIKYDQNSGTYNISSKSNGQFIYCSDKKHCSLNDTPSDLKIKSANGGKYNISVKDNDLRVLGYNKGSNTVAPRFAFYDNNSSMINDLQIVPVVANTTPTISVDPTELTFPAAGGEATINVTLKNSTDAITAESNNEQFTVAVAGNVVTVTAKANTTDAAINGTIAVKAGALSATVAVKQMAAGTVEPKYVKVTSAPADWSGHYLIINESNKLVFDGSLSTLDTADNCPTITINSDYTIDASEQNKSKEFTINVYETGYSIQSASGYYIGRSEDKNGIDTSKTDQYVNTISFNSNGTVDIIGTGGRKLNYNSSSKKFRYFSGKNSSEIYLYKLEN